MNQITQLSKNITSLQAVELAIEGIQTAHWKSAEVRKVAYLVRASFHEFEQKWRDLLERNSFFVFCIPSGSFYDGPPVFQHNPLDGDEVSQSEFEKGCEQLKRDIPKLISRMQESRNNLLSLQNQNSYISVFQEFDDSNRKLQEIAISDGQTANKDLQDWLERLISTLSKHGLGQRFNPNFSDVASPLSERIQRREEALTHMIDSLATNPTEHLKKDNITVNNTFGNNNVIGVYNAGTMQDINQITAHVKILAEKQPAIAESLGQLTAQIEQSELEPEAKEQAIDAVVTVSTELAKAESEQKGWKVKENLQKLAKMAGAIATAGGAWTKLEPYVTKLIKDIHQHLPHIPHF